MAKQKLVFIYNADQAPISSINFAFKEGGEKLVKLDGKAELYFPEARKIKAVKIDNDSYELKDLLDVDVTPMKFQNGNSGTLVVSEGDALGFYFNQS